MKNTLLKKLTIICTVPILALLSSCKKEPEIDLLLQSNNNYQNNAPQKTVENSEKVEPIETKVLVSIENLGRMDPFLPYKEKNLVINSTRKFSEIPLPPNITEEDETLTQMTQSKVTGILYDNEKPSAILDMDGEEYLIRKGDSISEFFIEDIQKEYVKISAGFNTYKAHIGEVIDGAINSSSIPDIENRFAGSKYNKLVEDTILITPIEDIDIEQNGTQTQTPSNPYLSNEQTKEL